AAKGAVLSCVRPRGPHVATRSTGRPALFVMALLLRGLRCRGDCAVAVIGVRAPQLCPRCCCDRTAARGWTDGGHHPDRAALGGCGPRVLRLRRGPLVAGRLVPRPGHLRTAGDPPTSGR